MPGIAEHDEAKARALARIISDRLRGGGAVAPGTTETVNEWSKRWLAHLSTKGYATVKDITSRIKRPLAIIGTTPMASVTKSQIEDVRDALDTEVARGDISWKTSFHAWSDVRCMFRDAVSSKDRSLRVREDDPTTGVRPPEKGADKSKTVLYPDEVATLLACAEVPVRYRVLYAVAIYTGMRAGELEALAWGDVDLEHGFIAVTKAVNRKTGEVDSTKTEATGDVPIEPALHSLLGAMLDGRAIKDCAAERLLWLPPDEDRAERIRAHLKAAQIDRAALFADDKRSKPIWFHDTRSTHLTWRAIRGDNPAVIQAVARHTSFQTTLGYINAATLLRQKVDGVFGPLPEALLNRVGELGRNWSIGRSGNEKTRNHSAIWRPQRELKATQARPESSPPDARSGEKQADPSTVDVTSVETPRPNSRPSEPERAPSIEMLRRKLDAAIDLEEWAAVPIIRERIRDLERAAAGNVVELRRREGR